MLNRILQTLFLCVAALILSTGIALSGPVSSSMLIAEHTPDHAETAQPIAQEPSQVTGVSQTNTSASTQAEREARSRATQPIQADPSVPYDPYDYDALREIEREIYGEAKGE